MAKKPIPPAEHQFKPGNPGRPPGSRNKLSEAFLSALCADFEANGVAVIAKVRNECPSAYLKVIASTVPQRLVVSEERRSLAEMSDEELAAIAYGEGPSEVAKTARRSGRTQH